MTRVTFAVDTVRKTFGSWFYIYATDGMKYVTDAAWKASAADRAKLRGQLVTVEWGDRNFGDKYIHTIKIEDESRATASAILPTTRTARPPSVRRKTGTTV